MHSFFEVPFFGTILRLPVLHVDQNSVYGSVSHSRWAEESSEQHIRFPFLTPEH